MNTEAALDRADFLERNKAELTQLMRESNIAEPVGVVADVRTFHGRQFALAMGLKEDVIDRDAARFLDEHQIPTIMAVITWKAAEAMMPHTSPTASRNLAAAKSVCKAHGASLMIAIMGEGNRYEVVQLPPA